MPLTKAALLLGSGMVLCVLALLNLRQTPRTEPPRGERGAGLGLGLCVVTLLLTVNMAIWQKQQLIAEGQALFVELTPVDPRSLMQGDYMQLAYGAVEQAGLSPEREQYRKRLLLVARRDARGVATFVREDVGHALAADEVRVELKNRQGRFVVASNAWFFKEGEASRWVPAKYAEFRVDHDGRALLVGLRGAELQLL